MVVNFSTLETKIGFEKTSNIYEHTRGWLCSLQSSETHQRKSNKQLQKPVSLTSSCRPGRKGQWKALLGKMTASTENKRRLTYKQFLEKYHQKVIQISPRNWNSTKVYYGCRSYRTETRDMNSERKKSVEIVFIKYMKYERFSIYVSKETGEALQIFNFNWHGKYRSNSNWNTLNYKYLLHMYKLICFFSALKTKTKHFIPCSHYLP